MKTYNPASSKAWANSADREFKKPIGEAGLLACLINSKMHYFEVERKTRYKGYAESCVSDESKPILIIEVMETAGIFYTSAKNILKILVTQGFLIRIRKPGINSKYYYYRREGKIVKESDIIDASTY